MDLCESNQALETPKRPLAPPEKTNGTTSRPRTREVSSRYKTPRPKRCPSPNVKRTVTTTSTSSTPVPKRAISAERKRPSTPPSPPSPSTPVHDTFVDMELAARKIVGSKLPESLWPSRMRSLSVSFQSDTFSLPISKREREKPVPQALSDRTLKPSSNVAQHKQTVTPPVSRKPTPERKRSPLKGKNGIDQSENSKPLDGLHARLVDQHRWPSRTSVKVSSNALNKSIDHTPNPGIGVPSLRRMSIPDHTSRPLQKSASDAVRLLSSIVDTGRLELDNPPRIPNLVSSSSSEKMTLITPPFRTQSLPSTPGSRPASPNKTSVFASRGVSPSRTRALNSTTTSRGVSPSRIRPSSPSRQSNNSNPASVLTFIADIRKGKKGASHIEDAHYLRLLYNRQLQWRFTNAQAEAVLDSQKVTAKTDLFNVWRATSELWDSISEKRIDLHQLRLKLKLYSVLNEQMAYLNEWALIERDQSFALSGAIEDLEASTLRLPVTGGARTDIETLKSAVCSAVQVMQTIGSSIYSTLSNVEGMNSLVSDLAIVTAQEREMLDECEALLDSAASLQVEEYSLRTHLIQLKQAWKSGE